MRKNLKGYLIANYNNMTNSYTCNRFLEESKKLGIDLRIIGIEDLEVFNGKVYNNFQELEERDFIINRYKWGNLKHEASKLGVRQFNPQDSFEKYIDKFQQLKSIESKYFKKPKYILSTGDIKFGDLESLLGDKVVAKGLEGSEGDQIFLIENQKDLDKLLDKFPRGKEFLFEEFISTSKSRDLRLFSVKGEAVAIMERSNPKDFRANFALGGSVKNYEIRDIHKKIAKDIYKQTGLYFVGIDLLFGEEKDSYYFCEINVMPGIRGIEKACNVNIGEIVFKTIRDEFENE